MYTLNFDYIDDIATMELTDSMGRLGVTSGASGGDQKFTKEAFRALTYVSFGFWTVFYD